ncbi:hypothetical protein H6P81_016901 [Aristolochia fimbriata]|uniref:Fatty acid desaturase domain-containing protein n=1 Tax=Aristolochia fimbriata TaxID=158543 RepID=A0AAV7DZN3_ARIFI|nr:hypothetical protein H6P81_016901 [Aristolochia fimbriata]
MAAGVRWVCMAAGDILLSTSTQVGAWCGLIEVSLGLGRPCNLGLSSAACMQLNGLGRGAPAQLRVGERPHNLGFSREVCSCNLGYPGASPRQLRVWEPKNLGYWWGARQELRLHHASLLTLASNSSLGFNHAGLHHRAKFYHAGSTDTPCLPRWGSHHAAFTPSPRWLTLLLGLPTLSVSNYAGFLLSAGFNYRCLPRWAHHAVYHASLLIIAAFYSRFRFLMTSCSLITASTHAAALRWALITLLYSRWASLRWFYHANYHADHSRLT